MNQSNKGHIHCMNTFLLKDIAREVVTCLTLLTCLTGLSAVMEKFIICDVRSGNHSPQVATENVRLASTTDEPNF